MESLADEQQAQHLMRFFKTDKGDYGEGDRFLGIRVPVTRRVVSQCKTLPLVEVDKLLASPWHEVRLCGLLVLVAQMEANSAKRLIASSQAIALRDNIVEFYLAHARSANNWDLVDLSVYKILGEWLVMPSNYNDKAKLAVIDRLAASVNLWEQRMSMVCTLGPLKHGDPSFTLRYAERHLHHPHDLMHKAVGWMLREMGKRVNLDVLREFLVAHVHEMPRTALRYAIELMDADERKLWMQK
ncbi:MAG: DNA alkylation repair protein [Muribaculaceae bacterium]|nr:DNA alkylation repair protein [Muribaculaceae bacterium]